MTQHVCVGDWFTARVVKATLGYAVNSFCGLQLSPQKLYRTKKSCLLLILDRVPIQVFFFAVKLFVTFFLVVLICLLTMSSSVLIYN